MSTSLAFVFPGQGSQSLGMLAELGAAHPLVLETFKEASDALGYDLWALGWAIHSHCFYRKVVCGLELKRKIRCLNTF